MRKPLYIINLGNSKEYYSTKVSWIGVPKEQASKFFHKDALKICNYIRSLRRSGYDYTPYIERADNGC